tara:strand:- start:318 stop:1016 length:699 start_codon:yes stop_codon:yes gene_type:complete
MKNNYAIFTSNSSRHTYFVQKLCEVITPEIIVVEPKDFLVGEIRQCEIEYFGENEHLKDVLLLNPGEINSQKVETLCRENNIDIAFVFGTSLIKENIIKSVNKYLLNLHTGLTQFYRGVDSSFWAIHNDDLDKIGITVHKIDLGIDTGNVILQERVEINSSDNEHSLFMKCCKLGTETIVKNIKIIDNNEIKVKKLEKQGKLYMKRHMNSEAKDVVRNTVHEKIRLYLELNK